MVSSMAVKNDRLVFLDNIKAILIILMVFGHLLILYLRDSGGEQYQVLWIFIYCFHMPSFLFISGYLEKNRKGNGSQSTFKLLIYYILMCIMVYAIRNGAGIETDFSLLYPPFAAWFLLVLFIFKLFLPMLQEMRHVIVLSLIVALASGLIDDLGMFLSLQRAAAFSVFFVMGYFVPVEMVNKLVSMRPLMKYLLGAACFSSIAVVAFYVAAQDITLEVFFNKLPYSAYFDNEYMGLVARALFICTSIAGIAGLLLMIPDRKSPFTYLGENSIGIYFFHTILFYALMIDSLSFITENVFMLLLVTVLYSMIAGLKPFTFILSKSVSLISFPFFNRK